MESSYFVNFTGYYALCEITNEAAVVSFTNSSVVAVNVGNEGAVFDVHTLTVAMSVVSCEFVNCSTSYEDGGVAYFFTGYNHMPVVCFTNTSFVHCSADENGGTISSYAYHLFFFTSCTFY